MSRAYAAIPYGAGSRLDLARPRRSGASSDARPSSARATASHERLLAVIPWIASTGSPPSGASPSRNVASAPPATGTSVLAIADKLASLDIDGHGRRPDLRGEVQPRPGAGEQQRAQRPTERRGLEANVF